MIPVSYTMVPLYLLLQTTRLVLMSYHACSQAVTVASRPHRIERDDHVGQLQPPPIWPVAVQVKNSRRPGLTAGSTARPYYFCCCDYCFCCCFWCSCCCCAAALCSPCLANLLSSCHQPHTVVYVPRDSPQAGRWAGTVQQGHHASVCTDTQLCPATIRHACLFIFTAGTVRLHGAQYTGELDMAPVLPRRIDAGT